MSEHTHEHSLHSSVDEIAILRAFHGHLGPYVFAGMRMGKYAVARLKADPHFGVEADVFCPDAPPPSCAIDGIQFSTGCTMGKRNIRHHVAEGVAARFVNRKSGETICVRLRPAALALAVEEMRLHNDEAGARVIERMSDEELLEELADL
ncbi:MAG: formylmethanofuran dehydrogenase [Armatimonadetes bacterium]|nr:formylmethanofuran dehydrogenase [Armatimonadota bacterium]